MPKHSLAILLLLASTSASAQVVPTAKPSPSLYAVNAAALASAMTYCSTRHGSLLSGSPGQACFVKARQVLATWGLKKLSAEIDVRCSDPATFNTCLTPEVGKLVYALNADFVKQDL
ncbi:MAG TPA: hypothetical protein VET30_05540 [Pseudoxanthomonas sp.]|nr:hypothetical protein [Pseudoxanthomonas sp.]